MAEEARKHVHHSTRPHSSRGQNPRNSTGCLKLDCTQKLILENVSQTNKFQARCWQKLRYKILWESNKCFHFYFVFCRTMLCQQNDSSSQLQILIVSSALRNNGQICFMQYFGRKKIQAPRGWQTSRRYLEIPPPDKSKTFSPAWYDLFRLAKVVNLSGDFHKIPLDISQR